METNMRTEMQIRDNSAFRAGVKKGYETYGSVFENTLRRLAVDLQQKVLKEEELTLRLVKGTYEIVKKEVVKFHMKDNFHKEIFGTLVSSWKYSDNLPRLFNKDGNFNESFK